MVVLRFFICVVSLALITNISLGNDLIYPLKDDREALSKLQTIVKESQGRDERVQESRAERLNGFVASNQNTKAAMVAQLILASDLMALSVANAGDERFNQAKEIFQKIRDRESRSWEGSVATVALMVWYDTNGNANSDSDWQAQIDIGIRFVKEGMDAFLDDSRDPYLGTLRMFDPGATGAKARAAAIGMLRETYVRLDKDFGEIESILLSQKKTPKRDIKSTTHNSVAPKASLENKSNTPPPTPEPTFAKKPVPNKKPVKVESTEPNPSNSFPYWVFIIGGVVVVGLVVVLKRKK